MNKTIILSLLFCIPILLLGASFFQGGDYLFHFEKSKTDCLSINLTKEQQSACETYAPLFHLLAQPFSFHENAFFYFTILLFIIISPLIISYYTKSWFSTLIYFCASNYVYYFMDGIFAQGLANILLFTLFFTKDERIEIGILPLLILSHGSAFFGGIALLLIKKIDMKGWLCSSIFGANPKNVPEIINTKLGSSGGIDFQINTLLHFIFITFPIPYLLISLKNNWDQNPRQFAAIIFLMAFGIIYAPRVWYLSFLIAIPGITQFYEKQEKISKIFLIVMTLIIGIIQFYLFWNYHIICV